MAPGKGGKRLKTEVHLPPFAASSTESQERHELRQELSSLQGEMKDTLGNVASLKKLLLDLSVRPQVYFIAVSITLTRDFGEYHLWVYRGLLAYTLVESPVARMSHTELLSPWMALPCICGLGL